MEKNTNTNTNAKAIAKSKLAKNEKVLIIIFSIAITFSACLFNQFDVLFRNQTEFGIQPQEIAFVYVLFSLVVLSVSLAALYLTARFFKRGFRFVLAAVLGLMLASYVQVLFLNGHYNGAFEGFAGGYKPISGAIKFTNLLVWIIVCLLPLALVFAEIKTKKDFFKKAVTLASVVILAMQGVGLATAAPNTDFRRYDNSFFLSINKQMELSKPDKENIIVFIIDRTAVQMCEEVFEMHPEDREVFEGFTFYRDSLSEYIQTFPSVVSMLTGEHFLETGSKTGFSKKAWEKATLFDELRARDYAINALLDGGSVYHDISEIEDKIDNITYAEDRRGIDEWRAFKALTKLSIQRVLPYALKRAAGFEYPNDLADIVTTGMSGYFPYYVGTESDRIWGETLRNLGLSANSDKNTFSFGHLYGGHNSDWQTYLHQSFLILGEYFTQMKQLGIFESSTIIVVADHGFQPILNCPEFETAALFIKEKGTADGEMEVNSTAKMSNGFFLSTIFELIGAEDKKTTTSYFDIIHRGAESKRYFYDTGWGGGDTCFSYGPRIEITD